MPRFSKMHDEIYILLLSLHINIKTTPPPLCPHLTPCGKIRAAHLPGHIRFVLSSLPWITMSIKIWVVIWQLCSIFLTIILMLVGFLLSACKPYKANATTKQNFLCSYRSYRHHLMLIWPIHCFTVHVSLILLLVQSCFPQVYLLTSKILLNEILNFNLPPLFYPLHHMIL